MKLRRQFDVRTQQDLNTIASRYWSELINTRRMQNWTRLVNCKPVVFERLCRRMQNHFSSACIDDDLIAGTCAVIEIAQTDDGSQTKTSRDDRHVRRPATSISGDCFHVIEI